MGIEYTAGGIAAADIAPVDIVAGFVDSDNMIYVDVGQTASKETGSRGQPYQTIMAAIVAVKAATHGTNSDTNPHTILVAPGTYPETIDLDGVELFNLSLVGVGGSRATFISPSAGNALETDENNTQLGILRVKGFTFTKPVSLVGGADDTAFLDTECIFDDCFITQQDGAGLTVTNVNKFQWKDGRLHILDTLAVQNVALFTLGPNFKDTIGAAGVPGNTTIKSDPNEHTPYNMKAAHDGDDLVEFRAVESFVQRKEPTFTTDNGGKIRVTIRWSHFGNSYGSMSFTTDEMLYAYYSTFYGNITLGAGSTLRWYNSFCRGTFDADSCTNKRFYTDTPDVMESKYILNVDKNAVTPTDGANGSARHPYKTIQAAIDAVVAAGDNSDAIAYVIKVAPGTYAETIDLDSTELYNLSFIAEEAHTVFISPESDNALETDANNGNLHYLYFRNFTFTEPISLVGADADTEFLRDDCVFEDCWIPTQGEGTTVLTVQNAGRFWWKNGAIHVLNCIAIQNVYSCGIVGESYRDLFPIVGAPGTTTLVVNTGANKPVDMGDMMTFWVKGAYVQRAEPTITCTAGIVRWWLRNAYFGLGMGLSIPANGHLYGENAVFPGNVTTNADSVVWLHNCCIPGTFTNNATDSHVYDSEAEA